MGEKKTILIADDDLTASRLLKLALEQAGYEVLAALDGMQAVQIAHREHLDLAILDINMPAQDGTRVAENLSLSPETFSIPIMFLSSNSREEAAKHGDISMARAYLQKPVKIDQLLDQVRQVFDQTDEMMTSGVIGGESAVEPATDAESVGDDSPSPEAAAKNADDDDFFLAEDEDKPATEWY